MNKYKILIFDLDDTLIDNFENTKHAFKKIIEFKKQNYSDDKFIKWYNIDKKFWKDWQNELIELPDNLKHETGKKSEYFLDWVRAQRFLIYFNNSINLEEAINLNNIYMNCLSEVIIPIEGSYEILNYLSKKYYIIIATNGPKIATKNKLEKIKCLNFVNEILSADMFGYMKPRKEFFNAIQKELNNYNNNDYLIIGDSLKSDIKFAMNCNFDSCWFNKNYSNLNEDYKPTIIINELLDLKNIL